MGDIGGMSGPVRPVRDNSDVPSEEGPFGLLDGTILNFGFFGDSIVGDLLLLGIIVIFFLLGLGELITVLFLSLVLVVIPDSSALFLVENAASRRFPECGLGLMFTASQRLASGGVGTTGTIHKVLL